MAGPARLEQGKHHLERQPGAGHYSLREGVRGPYPWVKALDYPEKRG